MSDPIANYETAIRLSEFCYGKNGIVSNSIDYMVALMCLDRLVLSKAKKTTNKIKANKELMKATLETIDDKSFIRNALHTQMVDGIAFYYFETTGKMPDNTKFMTDYDVMNISEINSLGINASIIPLPWEYTKIIGKKNGRYILAFNLRYFDNFYGENLQRKLRKYPKEIVDGYCKKKRNSNTNGDWLILDNNKTMCKKIKCKDNEPWGRSVIIAALSDILYKDYFIDTKRAVLDEINNKVIYQLFPESEKGKCSLTINQQEDQHATVKQAIVNKNNRGGVSFISLAAGTKLDSIDVNTDIFDSKNESDLDNTIAMDLGISASLIGAMTTGNFAAGVNNLEMITSQIYSWVCEWQNELNHVINANIIKDDKNKVEIYYFPTSFVNRQKFFEMMKSLYTEAGGSLSFLIASTGVDPDVYLSTLNMEIDEGYYEKYLPHQSMWTNTGKDDGGRPAEDNPTNENTLKSKANGSNSVPKTEQ